MSLDKNILDFGVDDMDGGVRIVYGKEAGKLNDAISAVLESRKSEGREIFGFSEVALQESLFDLDPIEGESEAAREKRLEQKKVQILSEFLRGIVDNIMLTGSTSSMMTIEFLPGFSVDVYKRVREILSTKVDETRLDLISGRLILICD